MLKCLLPDFLKVDNTIDAIRLRLTLTSSKTIRLTGKCFFYTTLRFTQSPSGPLGEIGGFI